MNDNKQHRLSIGARLSVFALVATIWPTAAGTARAALTVQDDLGRRVTLAHAPQRIVSLAPSVTEILFAVGAQGRLVGDTVYCDYPPAALKLPHVGGVVNYSYEKIVSLRPDLVIVASQTMPAAAADALAARFRIPVYVSAAASYADAERSVATLGALAGTPPATQATLHQMRAALSRVRKAVVGRPLVSTFVVISQHPLMTAGGTSFIGDLVRLAGGANSAEHLGSPYPIYSIERLVQQNPSVILTGMPGYVTKPGVLSFPAAASLGAVRQRRVYAVPDNWTSRPGPRLSLGLLAIARALHPEAFAK